MKSHFTNQNQLIISKLLIFVLLIASFFTLKAEIKVTDAKTGQPLPKASIFDKNGVFIAVTNDEGIVPQNVAASSFPINIRYVGYVPLKLLSPDIEIVTMEETSYTLPEVVVDDVSRNILYLQAYVREYATAENSKDTLAIFKEQLVDYAIPVGKAKFKGWKKPRVLSQQEYEYKKIEKKDISIDTLLLNEGGKMRSTNFNITQKFKLPESILSGDSTEYVKYGKHYPEEKWNVRGNYYIYENDKLADYKDHNFQPGILKILGMTMAQTMCDYKYIFEKEGKKGANVENLVAASENFDLIMKGKTFKKATEQDEDTKLAFFTEMYVIDRAYLTADEAKELKKDAPVVEITNFQVPSGIPAPPEEVVNLKAAVLESIGK
ncbi:MAG: hypothetical protein J1F12_08535 [Muribaculaceae bacterium]|nr:hypothetical protein [Muribaculaceae bacterium]